MPGQEKLQTLHNDIVTVNFFLKCNINMLHCIQNFIMYRECGYDILEHVLHQEI